MSTNNTNNNKNATTTTANEDESEQLTQQIGNLSINTDILTVYSNCGKQGNDLNACNSCDLVAYCNAACKKKHRTKHKKKCERRAAELHDIKLFKQPPQKDDCPICMLLLPTLYGVKVQWMLWKNRLQWMHSCSCNKRWWCWSMSILQSPSTCYK